MALTLYIIRRKSSFKDRVTYFTGGTGWTNNPAKARFLTSIEEARNFRRIQTDDIVPLTERDLTFEEAV